MTAAFDQLEADNRALRDAVAARMDATPEDDPKKHGYSPMAASLAGCKPAQEAAARCFDTTTDPTPTEIADSDTPVIPVDWILQGQKEFDAQRLRGDGVMNAGKSLTFGLTLPIVGAGVVATKWASDAAESAN